MYNNPYIGCDVRQGLCEEGSKPSRQMKASDTLRCKMGKTNEKNKEIERDVLCRRETFHRGKLWRASIAPQMSQVELSNKKN